MIESIVVKILTTLITKASVWLVGKVVNFWEAMERDGKIEDAVDSGSTDRVDDIIHKL